MNWKRISLFREIQNKKIKAEVFWLFLPSKPDTKMDPARLTREFAHAFAVHIVEHKIPSDQVTVLISKDKENQALACWFLQQLKISKLTLLLQNIQTVGYTKRVILQRLFWQEEENAQPRTYVVLGQLLDIREILNHARVDTEMNNLNPVEWAYIGLLQNKKQVASHKGQLHVHFLGNEGDVRYNLNLDSFLPIR